ncbi:MAG: hypothetical protein ACXAD7_21310 [Candidatus Kariarchaeaceae archaeon]|jgi:hypothetical protein
MSEIIGGIVHAIITTLALIIEFIVNIIRSALGKSKKEDVQKSQTFLQWKDKP